MCCADSEPWGRRRRLGHELWLIGRLVWQTLTPVAHGTDVLYVFGLATQKSNYTAAQEEMGKAMMDYW